MQRIKIDLPEKFSFSIRIPVRITDINYGNHLGNQVMLSIAHEARVRYLQQYGYTELNVEGVSLIMADAGIEFKAEVLYGDELEVEVATGATNRVGFDLLYRASIWREMEKSYWRLKLKPAWSALITTQKKQLNYRKKRRSG